MKVRVLFLGLLVFSFLFAGGRKVIGKEVVVPRMRMLSAREIMREILQKFPEMVPDWCKDNIFVKGDTEEVIELFPFSKVEGVDLLQRFLPYVNFYKGINLVAMYPYFIAISGTNKYKMPQDFNRLILDNGLEVTDKNILELAKMFVILAVGSEPVFLKGGEWGEWRKRRPSLTIEDELLSFPQITFLEGKRINMWDSEEGMRMDAELKIRIGDGEIQKWRFSQTLYRNPPGEKRRRLIKVGQFTRITVFVNEKPYRSYEVWLIEEKLKGELDSRNPRIEIATNIGNATVENDSFHYLITNRNKTPTNSWLRFRLYSFNPMETVYIKIKPIRPYIYGPEVSLVQFI
ncbi:MAG: hypothetical protein NZ608_04375 [candidate division WOR-3 bacterium]|nr:hypothetical protein [candidate division WOR-3 bacterium]